MSAAILSEIGCSMIGWMEILPLIVSRRADRSRISAAARRFPGFGEHDDIDVVSQLANELHVFFILFGPEAVDADRDLDPVAAAASTAACS